ncbi:MAG TPA: acyl-CoA dehydrogenase, partial [Halieaceae bacterium]|nr:acyl-CoA dehydrogenase [Halieaceae bacterium]
FGGQNLPWSSIVAINEIWQSTNMSFALNNLLTQGAIELIESHGSTKQKGKYLPNLIQGKWSGTMNLTEPHAGSDLSFIKTKAYKNDNHYLIKGTKIYITHGDQDMSDNIVHLVLAKLPNSPEGVKGISLFIVPKFYSNENGQEIKNDIKVVSVEHKLGHSACPTCVLSFGEDKGAVGELIGEPNQGLKAMFTMMNNARLGVGGQGIGVAEAAFQHATDYALNRKQGKATVPNAHGTIIDHADVRRMLISMRADIFASRSLELENAKAIDMATATGETEWVNRAAFLTPITKVFGTEIGVNISYLGVQIHGGMGYVEETGAAQYLRDVRITPIYEGTNGIQAADLVNRKLARDGGAMMEAIQDEIRGVADALIGSSDDRLSAMGTALADALSAHVMSSQTLLDMCKSDKNAAMSASFDYMMQTGYLFGGWHLAASSLVAIDLLARNEKALFCQRKIATTEFYLHRLMPRASAHADAILSPLGTLDGYASDWL